MRLRLVATGLLMGALAAGTTAAPQGSRPGTEQRRKSEPSDKRPDSQLSPVPQDTSTTFEHNSNRHLDSTNLRQLPLNLLRDQKVIWLSPLHIDRQQWPWLAAGAGASAVLFATDSSVGEHLTDSPPGTGYDVANEIGRWSGGLTDLLAAGSFLAIGQWKENQRASDTGVLGLRAVLNSMAVVGVLKVVTQRTRPADSSGLPNHEGGEFFAGGLSFPSGHAAEVWALAVVVAKQYPHRRLPPLAYGLATMVAVARVPARQHFPSDVFVGSAMGYLIGRYVWQTEASEKQPLAYRPWRIVPQMTPGGGAALVLDITLN